MEVKQIRPLHDRVLVKPNETEEVTTKSGLIIPKIAVEEKAIGEVVAIGTGLSDKKFEVKEGDTVMYGKFAGQDIEVNGQKYLIMRESDIMAVIDKE